MEIASFRHQSDSRFCFSLDEHRVLLRLAVARSVSLHRVQVVFGDPMSFARSHRYADMALRHTDAGYHYYEIVLDVFPARLMYVFLVDGENRSCYFSESGLTDTYKFDLGFISAFQFVGENKNDFVVEKPSWQGKVFYQIFPERFNNGLGPKSYVNTPWNEASLAHKYRAFLGGDLQGVIDKLDYLDDLGIEVIYLTPVHPSISNHKYDVLDYFDVDAGFGGKEVFHRLVEEAHRRGMKVMMDMVFNHCANGHPFFKDVILNGRQSKYHSWFFIDGDKPRRTPLNYRCFGTFAGMPKLNTNNKEVQSYLIEVASYWMEDFGVDGFRLDVSEGVSHDFWVRLKIALKEIDPEVLLVGENWLNSESYLGVNQLDSVMNYPFLGVTSGYVLRIRDAKDTADALDGLLMRYKDGYSKMMLNILASHDVRRFLTLCGGDADLSLIGYAMMMFYWGHPMIYYGEEIFMQGAEDPDNRRGMQWDSKQFQSYRHSLFKELIRLRKLPVLKAGDIEIKEQDGLLMIARKYDGKTLKLYCNMNEHGVRVAGKEILSNRYAGEEVWPKGFVVIEE